jgi:hypothetical protein
MSNWLAAGLVARAFSHRCIMLTAERNCGANEHLAGWVDFPESRDPPAWAFPAKSGKPAVGDKKAK